MSDKSKADQDYHNRIAAEYFSRHRWPIQRYTCQIEKKWITKYIPKDSNVLVAGCGGGREIPWLLNNGCCCTGYDYAQEMIDLAKHVHGESEKLSWIQGDIHCVSGIKTSFDVVLCLAAINYFENIPKSVEQMAAALKPGGRMIISSINRNHPTEIGFDPSAIKSNRRPLNTQELSSILIDAGFTIYKILQFRILPDILPPKWNRVDAPLLKRLCIETSIFLDQMWRFLPRQEGKFFWIVADKA